MTIKSFNPKHRLLMGPGPSPIYPSVLHALSRPTIGHLDPLFIEMMEEVSTLLRHTFQTENKATKIFILKEILAFFSVIK